MKIMMNGINTGLKFSSAHIIPVHTYCGFIHGHSYFMDVEIDGGRSGDYEFVVDFKDVKKKVKDICEKLDHRFLIPIKNENMNFKGIANPDESGKSIKSRKLNKSNGSKYFSNNDNLSVLDFCNKDHIEFTIKNKDYKLPIEDCVLLPLKHSSAEELSQYFANIIFEDLEEKGCEINAVSVCVNEGIGQGAVFKKV